MIETTQNSADTLAHDGALVLFSGGQDSATVLAWALERFAAVETVGFRYGQRHGVELECRTDFAAALRGAFPAWGRRLGDDHLHAVEVLGEISETALTRPVEIAMDEAGLPTTFVPGRNLLFFTLAAAIAYRRGIRHVVAGVCETDSSGYPDCRDDTVKAMQAALNLGMASRLVLHTPLMWRTKAQTWQLAEALGGEALVELIRTGTHTCYLGERGTLHPWGHGCGECPACLLRMEGWRIYREGGS